MNQKRLGKDLNLKRKPDLTDLGLLVVSSVWFHKCSRPASCRRLTCSQVFPPAAAALWLLAGGGGVYQENLLVPAARCQTDALTIPECHRQAGGGAK